MKRKMILLVLLLAGQSIIACGQKGALYLPKAHESNPILAVKKIMAEVSVTDL